MEKRESGRGTLMPLHPEPFPDAQEWRGWMVRAIDGDTIVVKLDLGFRVNIEIDVRLKDVDAPEIVGANKAAGIAARDFLNEQAPAGTPIRVWTYRMRRSFNRYVAEMVFWRDGVWHNVARVLVDNGHGVWV